MFCLSINCHRPHRRRPACTFPQTDQCLCYSLIGKYHIQPCYEGNFYFLASLSSWAGWFESHLAGNPEDRFLSITARLEAVMVQRERTVFGPNAFFMKKQQQQLTNTRNGLFCVAHPVSFCFKLAIC